MSLADLISSYGYLAILIGTFLEGETILILGGLAAHGGYLNLPLVILSAFIGTLFGDQLYFFIGRYKGLSLLETRPVWKEKSSKVFSLLEKHEVMLILGFRFLYGLRTVTPFLIGASKIKTSRFVKLNIIGAALWATVVGILGYWFGRALELIIGDIKHYETMIFIFLILVALSVWSYYFFKNKRKVKQQHDENA
jgi:membrane protein DedA with SNARE-associated domain